MGAVFHGLARAADRPHVWAEQNNAFTYSSHVRGRPPLSPLQPQKAWIINGILYLQKKKNSLGHSSKHSAQSYVRRYKPGDSGTQKVRAVTSFQPNCSHPSKALGALRTFGGTVYPSPSGSCVLLQNDEENFQPIVLLQQLHSFNISRMAIFVAAELVF